MTSPNVYVDAIAYLKKEVTAGTALAFVAGDAISFSQITIKPELQKVDRQEQTGSASYQGRLNGKYMATGTIEFQLKLNSYGTAPEQAPVLEGGFGSQSTPGGVRWSCLGSGAPPSYQLGVIMDTYYVQCNRLIIKKLDFESEGGAIFSVKAEFEAAEFSELRGDPQVEGAHDADTAIVLETNDAKGFRCIEANAGFLVQFSSAGDNSGSGYALNAAVDFDTDTITITPASPSNEPIDAEYVTPFQPTPTYDGAPIMNVDSGLSIDGTAVGFTKFTCSYETGHHLGNLEATTARANRQGRGSRKITGTMSFYNLDENKGLSYQAWANDPVALIHRAGPDTQGERFKLTMARVTVDTHELPVTGEGFQAYEATWVAEENSAADDEIQADAD